MDTISLLIVEDDEQQLKSWKNVIDMHNVSEGHAFEIRHEIASTLIEASELIKFHEFDASIVDVRLKQRDGAADANTDGNSVAKILIESEMAVVALFTGESTLAEPPSGATKVKTFTKGGGDGEGTEAVMTWLTEQVPMILQIRAAQQTIKREMAKIFSRSIWPRWYNWLQSSDETDEFIQTAVARHITSHVYAALLADNKQGAHPEEWYFVPPLNENINTGDLVKLDDGSIGIVITPRCDLARNNKNETIQLAICKDISDEWNKRSTKILTARESVQNASDELDEKARENLKKRLEEAEDALRRYSQHNSNSSVFHFLPRMKTIDNKDIGPFFVQFDKIQSIPRISDDSTKKIRSDQRIATVTSEFLPSLVERLGSYFSRIGTPDYSHPE